MNAVLDEILEKLFAPNGEFMTKVKKNDKLDELDKNYAFDKNKTMVALISDVVKEVVESRNYQIPEVIKIVQPQRQVQV